MSQSSTLRRSLSKFAVLVTFGSAAVLTQACESKVRRRDAASGGATDAEIHFWLPAPAAFALKDGDPATYIQSHWYTFKPKDPACGAAYKSEDDFESATSVTQEVKPRCEYDLTVAVGKDKKAYYKTPEALDVAAGDHDVPVRLRRTAAGESAGFTELWVEADSLDDEADQGDEDDEGDEQEETPDTRTATYADIKGILDDKCISCHVKTGTRPNSDLTTYAGAKAFGELLTDYVVGGRMPPPPATLTEDEKRLVKAWQTGGFLEDASSTPPTPEGTPPGGPDETGSSGNIVEFRIKAGTGRGAWNTAETAVVAKVGQTVRIVNDDSETHQLHTNGAPCPHGNPIPPGQSRDCVVSRPYSGGPLYDHGTRGDFFIRADR